MDGIRGMLSGEEVSPEQYEAWKAKYGERRAKKLLSWAAEGGVARKDQSTRAQVAMEVYKTERKARAQQDAGPRVLNISVLQMPMPGKLLTAETDCEYVEVEGE